MRTRSASPRVCRRGWTSARRYFSVITITTTGFGDIAPLAGVARLVTCWEVVTGVLYQVFVFSLAAALITPPHDGPNIQAPQ